MDKLWKIKQGHVLNRLAELPDESVQCIVTSPPYWGLRDYGVDGQIGLEPTIDEYLERMVAVCHEIKRVLRTDGTFWLNMGDCYAGGGRASGKQLDENGIPIHDTAKQKSNRGSHVMPSPVPIGLKPKDLIGQPWRLAFALQADGWWLRSDIIWCLSGGARVYAKTQKGEMPMTIKDMVRLRPETVQLWNGEKWTQVLGWNKANSRDGALEIELRSGERIGCTSGHQWPTQRGLVRADELRKGDVIQTCRLPGRNRNNPSHLRHEIGWFIGHYLAEGSRSGDTIQISCHKKELPEIEKEWRALAEAYGGSVHSHCYHGNAATVCVESSIVRAIIDHYIGGRTAKNKHLKPAVWMHNDMFLGELLDGYLQGDGHYDKKNDRWRLGFTRNDYLAADLRTLCARLDVDIRLKISHGNIGDKTYPTYRGSLRMIASRHWNAKQSGEVIAIRKSRARQFWDIGVEDEPHLFALASGVLTHNSKPNPMPESVTDRPTKAHEYVFLLTKSAKYYYDNEAVREDSNTFDLSIRDRENTKLNNVPGSTKMHGLVTNQYQTRNRRTVWHIPTQPFPGAHFATFPEKLIEPCIKAGTSKKGCCPVCGAPWERVTKDKGYSKHRPSAGNDPRSRSQDKQAKGSLDGHHGWRGNNLLKNAPETIGWQPTCDCSKEPVPCLVLDPFNGSGTTGVVAVRNNCRFLGIELSEKYCIMAEKRIERAAKGLSREEQEAGQKPLF